MEFRSHLTVALRVIGRDGEVAVGVRTASLELLREQPDLTRCPLRAVNGRRRGTHRRLAHARSHHFILNESLMQGEAR
jgi:hypothetical protein